MDTVHIRVPIRGLWENILLFNVSSALRNSPRFRCVNVTGDTSRFWGIFSKIIVSFEETYCIRETV
jgi:hypothetical protein